MKRWSCTLFGLVPLLAGCGCTPTAETATAVPSAPTPVAPAVLAHVETATFGLG